MTKKIYDYAPSEALDSEESIAVFIADAFETGDFDYVAKAMKVVARAKCPTELTTQKAADLLDVSRVCLLQLLEEGKIPFRKVGSKRCVLAKDVLYFKMKTEKQRLKALGKLANQAQKLGMGY